MTMKQPIPPGGTGQFGFDAGPIEGGDGFGVGGDFGFGLDPLLPPKPILPPPGAGDAAEPPPPPQGDVVVRDHRETQRTGSAAPTPDEIEAAAAKWNHDVLTNGSQGFMSALLNGDPSAKAALKDPTFMATLQMKMKEENQLISTLSNMIEALHQNTKAAIVNIRV